jgi:hypothetical protein
MPITQGDNRRRWGRLLAIDLCRCDKQGVSPGERESVVLTNPGSRCRISLLRGGETITNELCVNACSPTTKRTLSRLFHTAFHHR